MTLKYPCFSIARYLIDCTIPIDCTALIDGTVLHDCTEVSIDYSVPIIVRLLCW
jgi:hypothetical protein